MRASSDIQFAPVAAPPPPKPPVWLEWLQDLLKTLFEPLGRWLGLSWHIVENILIALAVLGALFLLWRLAAPILSRLRTPRTAPEAEWLPARAEAEALLEDADRLAAEGRFDEATHLLLKRSVQQIARARPDWLHPASTAREIAALPHLPAAARAAFATIAERVEHSFFALRALDRADWTEARAAYARFALQDMGQDMRRTA